MLGTQVPTQSGMVQWASGHTTVLPCVLKEGKNICEGVDVRVIKFLAKYPESKPGSDNVVHLKSGESNGKLLQERIGDALAKNKAVVIRAPRGYVEPSLDKEYLESNFGISPNMPVTIHGKSCSFFR